ncbi:MAG: hypothetical protein ABIQ30_03570 [Devosia sp.]
MILRVVLAALGVAAIVAAALSLMDLSSLGFPDGYITPYDHATLPWVTGLGFTLLIAGIFTLAATAFKKPRRAIGGAIIAILLYISLTMLDACPRLEWCTAAALQFTGIMLDDGQGG